MLREKSRSFAALRMTRWGALRMTHWGALGMTIWGAAALAQSPVADSVMRLNRAGRYEQAAQLARRAMGASPAPSVEDRCALNGGAIVALAGLGAYTLASDELQGFDRICSATAAAKA